MTDGPTDKMNYILLVNVKENLHQNLRNLKLTSFMPFLADIQTEILTYIVALLLVI